MHLPDCWLPDTPLLPFWCFGVVGSVDNTVPKAPTRGSTTLYRTGYPFFFAYLLIKQLQLSLLIPSTPVNKCFNMGLIFTKMCPNMVNNIQIWYITHTHIYMVTKSKSKYGIQTIFKPQYVNGAKKCQWLSWLHC